MSAARQPIAPLFVKVSRAPEVFDVSVATIYRAKDRGEIVIYKRGAASYLEVAAVAAWLKGRQEAA